LSAISQQSIIIHGRWWSSERFQVSLPSVFQFFKSF
jgi:hypothetical protein